MFIESRIRPGWRDRLLVPIAWFDFEGGPATRAKPLGHVLRSLSEETGRAAHDGEDNLAYCRRVFGIAADASS